MIGKKMMPVVAMFLIAGLTLLLANIGSLKAQTPQGEETSKKLEEILKNQKEILQGIASIKEELDVIKIRVTR